MGAVRIAQRLTKLFDQTITIQPWTGQDAYGQATFGSEESYRAHIQDGAGHTFGQSMGLPGEFKVIIGEAVKIDPRDKMTLPTEYGTRNDSGDFEAPTMQILKVHYLNDTRGHVATTVLCGRTR